MFSFARYTPSHLLRTLLVLSSLCLLSLQTLGDGSRPPLVLSETFKGGSIGPYMDVLIDPEGQMDLAAVMHAPEHPSESSSWRAVNADNVIGGFTTAVYWIRFSLENQATTALPWFLEVNYALLDHIEFYEPDGRDGFTMTLAGDHLPYAERPIDYRHVVFPIQTPAESNRTYYLRIKTSSSMYIELNLWSHQGLVESMDAPLAIHGFVYGIVFLSAMYCLMNAIFLRERMYLFISLGIIGSIGYSTGINGFAYQYIWPNNQWLQSVTVPFFLNVCFGFSLLYSREFLNLKQMAPRTDRLTLILGLACVLCAALSLFVSYAIMIRISTVFAITMSLVAFWGGIISYYKGNKTARFYLVGWLSVVVGAITFALKTLGIIPSNLFTVWMQEFGFAGIAIFLTVSQSDHFFRTKRVHEAEQTKAMDAIRDAERKYRTIFENAIEGIFQMDQNGKLFNANKAFARILGRRDVSALLAQEHKPFSLHCLSDAERDRFRSILEQEGDIVSDFQSSFKLPSGEDRWISVSLQRTRIRPDDPSHFEGSVTDITEKKKRLLAEKQRHMAEASTEAKSLFLANMSHEIRTPMNAIIGFTDLAMDHNKDTRMNEYLRKIRMASGNLLGIINDILDFSKIEAGKLEIEHTPFSLQEVLNNLRNIVSVSIASKKLEFDITIDEDIPDKLIGDPLRIGQVLLNLTNNAIKFTQQGSVRVELELLEMNKQNMALTLRAKIIDTGIGIAPDKLKNLFTSFTQADQSTTRRYGGTGLGLSISKQLISMMGGELSVQSVPDQGSTFSFTLGLKIQDRRKRSVPAFNNNDLPLNVLVVDDQADARELLEKALLSLAHNVRCVASGDEAIRELRDKQAMGSPYDVLIADWYMPDMDGISCCQYVREQADIVKPRMLIMTGYDLEDARTQAAQIGIDAFMLKPIKVQELAEVLKQVFRDRRSGETESALPQNLNFNGTRVLLVDDVAMNQDLAKEILDRRGFVVSVANNGEEAVAAVADQKYDLVLMDMQMPVMDGCQATEKIRQFDRTLPIIAMTANAMMGDKNRCLAAGMNDYVTKPINPDELLRTIARWVTPSTLVTTRADDAPETIATNKAPEVLPASLPGIDLASGLSRCQNNARLYLKLLQDLKRDYGQSHVRLQSFIEASDYPAIAILGHTLKGLAGNLSAANLARAAAQLEKFEQLSAEAQALAQTEFTTALNTVVESITQLESIEQQAKAAEPTEPPFSEATARAQLAALLEQVKHQKIEAYELAQECQLRWPDASQSETWQHIVAALDSFDFARAEALLREF